MGSKTRGVKITSNKRHRCLNQASIVIAIDWSRTSESDETQINETLQSLPTYFVFICICHDLINPRAILFSKSKSKVLVKICCSVLSISLSLLYFM